MENEIICPTTHGTKCIDCKLCSGFAKNIVIQVHGAKVKGLLKKLKPFK
jgi:Pyruvate/2-oxoacid:ferredoxin oxidoreductase delta subunit